MTIIKHTKLLTLALPLVALTLVAPAKAQDKMGLYVSGGAGFTMTGDIKRTLSGKTKSGTGTLVDVAGTLTEVYDKAPRFFGAVGYHIGDSARVELEFAYDSVGGKQDGTYTKPNGALPTSSKFTGKTMTGMLNAYYDLMPGSQIRPYVLGGIGYSNVSTKVGDEKEESSTGIAYQAGAGVSYALSDSMSVFADYRFRSILLDKETKSADNNATFTADSNINSHAGNVGLRFGF